MTPRRLRVSGIHAESIVDGPGFRLAVFTQGCPHGCPGCHNPQTHDPAGGTLMELDELYHQLTASPLNKGLTLSGGEPFLQAEACASLAIRARETGYNVWTYTGWTYEELIARAVPGEIALLRATHTLVDGRFIMARRTLSLPFRGSENQRILDVAASLALGAAVEVSMR